MIRLMGLVNLGKSFQNEAELTDKQKELDVDKDGEIEGSDLAKLRAKKNETVTEDHEVSMAQSTLDSIIRHATELKGKLGQGEKDIPAWIQDHITNSENYIDQANTSYHEYPSQPTAEGMCEGEGCEDTPPMTEKSPEGWEGTVKAMKKHKEIDNPWALANYMKNKGYQSHKGE